jgi:hypothetical protein
MADSDIHEQVHYLWHTLCHIHYYAVSPEKRTAEERLALIGKASSSALDDVNKLMDAVWKVADAIEKRVLVENPFGP